MNQAPAAPAPKPPRRKPKSVVQAVARAHLVLPTGVAQSFEALVRHSACRWKGGPSVRMSALHLSRVRGIAQRTAQTHLGELVEAGVLVTDPGRRRRQAHLYYVVPGALWKLRPKPKTRAIRRAEALVAISAATPEEDRLDPAEGIATVGRSPNNEDQDHQLPDVPDFNETKRGAGWAGGLNSSLQGKVDRLSPAALIKKFYPGLSWPREAQRAWLDILASGFDGALVEHALTRACAIAVFKGLSSPEMALAWWILKSPTRKDIEMASTRKTTGLDAGPRGELPQPTPETNEGPRGQDPLGVDSEMDTAPDNPQNTAGAQRAKGIAAAQAAFAAKKKATRPKKKKRRTPNPAAEATKAIVASLNAAGLDPEGPDPFIDRRGRYHAYYAERRRTFEPGYAIGAAHRKKLDAAEDHLLKSRVPESFWPELFDEMERFWEYITRDREGRATYPPPELPANNSFVENWIAENKPGLRFTKASVTKVLEDAWMDDLVGTAFATIHDGVLERLSGKREYKREYLNLIKAGGGSEGWTAGRVLDAIDHVYERHWALEVAER